jgi:tetratricopeptide (TPR) repeat protein
MAERGAPETRRFAGIALRQYQEMARLDPALLSWPEPHLHLGKAYVLQGKVEEARQEYEEALRISGSFAAARLDLAHLWRAKGELEQAMRGYREVAFSFGPGTAPLRQAALQAMEELCQARPQEIRWHYWLGQLYRALGKREAALGRLRAAIAHSGSPAPTFLPQVHFLLGRLLEEKGSLQEAAEEYGLALTLAPDHLEALRRLKPLSEKAGKKEEGQAHGSSPGQALERRIAALTPPHPAEASFSPALELLGFALDKEAILSSGRFRLTLYWRPRQELEGELQVQAWLEREMGWAGKGVSLASSGRLSSRPASGWRVGEVVRESYEFVHREDPLPSASEEGELPRPEDLIRLGFPPGDYTLRVVATGPGFSVEQKGLGRVRLP